jgi:hypothetical protein
MNLAFIATRLEYRSPAMLVDPSDLAENPAWTPNFPYIGTIYHILEEN